MWIDRRSFLKHAVVAGGSVLALPRLGWTQGAAKEPGARTLVLLHLNGGNDGLNTVVPYKDSLYPVLRQALALNIGQIRKIDENLGLHPALSGFEDLWKKERLAIINGVGYPNPNYSHFRATEIWFTAQPANTPVDGWVGRVLDARASKAPLRAVSLTKEKPLSLQCSSPGVATLTDFRQFQVPAGMERAVELYGRYGELDGERGRVGRAGSAAIRVANKIAALQPYQAPLYGRLGQDLRKVLALLNSDIDLEVIQLSFGGFDTHANQAGTHNGLLAQVGNNLRNYQNVLDQRGLSDRVTTLVFSEFGRRAAENLSGGTDHGSAGPVFLLGKGVRPGLHGSYPALDDLERGNFKYTTDFRSVYAAVARDFLNLDPDAVKKVAGDHKPLELFA